ncbi:hypothetical protein F8M41_021515 [Gigaspora margarita]|uniref:F-box domain-containing protein n=1 Tax=Gigaspora margarita TaxID=4874 RepID=A0A8H4AGQ3_GIGMA|nr:hypothetical protein F8M41_021515 [Gigaspora margarita]
MASKIFTGSMPELMEKILNNLHVNNEFNSLYSCTLVNRHWCKVSIPILWQNPFSRKFSVWKSPFLKVLSLSRLKTDVLVWVSIQLYSDCFGENITSKDNEVINLIINLLFKLFIESGAILHRFGVAFSKSIELNQVIFYSLERNEQFFSQLQKLSVGAISVINSESAIILLKILAKFTKKIIALNLEFCSGDAKVFCALISIIKSQEQIRKFKFCGEERTNRFHGVISALECQKLSLREVTLDNCEYNEEFKVLSNFETLEILSFNMCDYKLLNTLDYKISTLEITDSEIHSKSIVSFLEKSGNLLQRIIFISERFWEESKLLEGLKSFCPNLKYLSIIFIKFSDQLLDLIKNLPKLQFLVLWIKDYVWVKEQIIKKFSEILPLTLQYLDLENATLNSYLDIWLNNCYTPLKSLLINKLKYMLKYKKLSTYQILHTKKNLELFGYLIFQI